MQEIIVTFILTFVLSVLLLALGIIVSGRPSWIQLHVDLALLPCLFIVFGLFFSAEAVPLKMRNMANN